jgi:GcrA cell cycle regulator
MTFIETPLSGAAYAIRHGNTSWTVERELTVRRLWKQGWSASQIAGELGHATRNAVIGKLNRLGLKANSRLPGAQITAPAPRSNRRPDGFRRKPLPKAPRILPPQPEPEVMAPISRSEAACSFSELGKDMCRYPFGDPRDADFAFCGRFTKSTYCSGHRRLCYTPPAPRQDRVSRR